MTGSWGPLRLGRDPLERKADLRCLRTCVKLLTGSRGAEAAYRLLLAEISQDNPEALSEAEAEFARLPAIDARRVLAAFSAVNFDKPMPCISPADAGSAHQAEKV